MTTASEIISQAFREANITPIGKEPTANERAEALPRLNNFISRLFGTTLGEFIMDWPVPPRRTSPVAADFPLRPEDKALPNDVWPYPPNNVRLLISNTSPQTIYLPFVPNPGGRLALTDVGATAEVTINANGRLIEGFTAIVWTPGDPAREWFYREDLGSWMRVQQLGFDDLVPLTPDFDDLLICGLAKRLAPRFGAETLRSTEETYMDAMQRLKQKYAQYMPRGGHFDPTMMSRQAHRQGVWAEDEGSLYGR